MYFNRPVEICLMVPSIGYYDTEYDVYIGIFADGLKADLGEYPEKL